MLFTERQAIEYFHLLFLQYLPTVLDTSMYALKGGCNLRFYFGSIRYSEDIDLDVKTVHPKTLEKNIDKLLNGTALKNAMRAMDFDLVEITKPKQTETTQRWKLQLLSHQSGRKTGTKIEFSRRGTNAGVDEGVVLERVQQAILDQYNLPRFACPHYEKNRAFSQKVSALVNRTEPQARDAFDLDLLLSQKAKLPDKETLSNEEKKAVHETLLQMTFEEYSSQVVAYLLPEHRETYGREDVWQEIQLKVTHGLD